MKFIPILFSTPMVQAILDNRKTQTRRVVKPQLNECNHGIFNEADWREQPFTPSARGLLEGRLFCTFCGNGVKPNGLGIRNPYGKVGDILWVRETFYAYGFWVLVDGEWHFDDCTNQFTEQYLFENCKPKVIEKGRSNGSLGWYKRPSLFMPKAACRIFLKITNVRVERLQDISEEDSKAEGVLDMFYGKDIAGNAYFNYIDKKGGWDSVADDAKHSFQTLWQSINGEQSWENNPWVWVIEFELIEKPEKFI